MVEMINASVSAGYFAMAIISIAISAILMISISLKIRDRSEVIRNYSARWTAPYATLFLYLVLALESVAVVLNIAYGLNSARIGAVTSVLLFAGALIGALIFRRRQGCLCFGVAAASPWFSPILFGCLLILNALVLWGPVEKLLPHIFVAVISVSIAIVYFVGANGKLKERDGERVAADKASLVVREIGSSEGAIFLIFASTSCALCLALMRFIDKISGHLPGVGRFYIDIEGVVASEDTVFAGCTVLRESSSAIVDLLSIDVRPCVVVIDGLRAYKHIGFQSCVLALSQPLAIKSHG